MNKLNFVSNPRITVFMKKNDDTISLTPDQIPSIIVPALASATRNEVILSCSIFLSEDYDNYVKALTTTWDGICVTKRCSKLFGDGSYDWIERDGSICWGIM